MPTSDADDRYYKTLISAVQDMSLTLGTVREQMAKDLADYLARYREDAHRATMALATRVTGIERQLEKDAEARTERQALLDAALAAIKADIEAVRKAGASRGWQIWALLGLMTLLVGGVGWLIILLSRIAG